MYNVNDVAPLRPFIVALTSYVDDEVECKCHAKGFDLVIQGPLTRENADIIVAEFRKRKQQ